ncbi:thiolase family protein [Streptomyces sp. 3214.6]|uniref:thiolase family protein n=1 Tax=Streptomyces sp. 3214.6 TaxID=1882757 RepID=UPI00090A9311|nr:thiolase family protein [Streptomyces sp. 3214.6]SHH29988.1 acetyl-CoA C-acetyltransferase/acetyl-CoA acyltransferase [Streptomyces sp. 3214.6]
MTVESYIYDGLRTPFGRYGRALAHIRPDDLAADVISSLLARHPGLDPARVDDVVLGDANGAGEDNRNVARMSALLAGLPTSVPGATVNRLCGSGLEAIVQASRAIEAGDADIVIAGGVESMSRAPWILPKPDRGFPPDNQTLYSSTLGWRMTNPKLPPQWTVSNGVTAEILADRFAISREEQDAFALRSHRLAAAADSAGAFTDELMTPAGSELVRDEGIRADTDLEKLAALPPAFRSEGTVTAGNSSPLNDGAAALLIANSAAASAGIDGEPLARIVSRAVVGNDPDIFGIAPVEAANKALARAGLRWQDVDLVELNEAFAAQSLACLKSWPELDPQRVNIHGGAIAIGHPLGASGARITLHLARELRRRGGGVGLAALCIGTGQGIAMVIQA